MKASWLKYELKFKEPATTSRNTLTTKPTWLLNIESEEFPEGNALGEIAMFPGLSREDTPDFEQQIREACDIINRCNSLSEAYNRLPEVSSIRFGVESALFRANPNTADPNVVNFLHGNRGIRINGLVWMGDKPTMRRRIREKLNAGFHCIKLKIGGIDFNDEIELLRDIRAEFTPAEIELRLDANGAFTPANAMERLQRLAEFEIHSIEQPIKAQQWEDMHRICSESPIPIALDEELIGFRKLIEKQHLLDAIRPQYIILKPSLCGGFAEADQWIAEAEKRGINWWGTSALESNIGLEALALWTASHNPSIPQGLGTGALYTNNFPSPLRVDGEFLRYFPNLNPSEEPIQRFSDD